MDVNGARFHLLNGRGDWFSRLAGTQLAWNEGRAFVHLRPRLLRLPERRRRVVLGLDERRGADRDRFGHLYWIDDDRRGIRFRAGGEPRRGAAWWTVDALHRPHEPGTGPGGFRPVHEAEPPLPTLRGLAVTARHFLVAGTLDPGGFLVFDLHGGGPPDFRIWPGELGVRPLDLAAGEDGGVWVLDRDRSAGEVRLWHLDRHFHAVPEGDVAAAPSMDFHPADGPEHRFHRLPPRPLELTAAVPEAVAVAALPGHRALLLESDPGLSYSRLHLVHGGAVTATVSLEGILDAILDAGPGDLRGHDLAVVGTDLFIAEDDGQQVFAFDLEVGDDALVPRPQSRFLPMRGFTGKALVAAPPGEVLYDFARRWLPLAEQPRPRYGKQAELAGLVFDGREPGTVWHRLLLDACIPAGDAVEVASRAAEREDLLEEEAWRPEPGLYRRGGGSEIPYHEPFTADERRSAGAGTWELLFQQARGRFLELRLGLRGSGRSTPRLRSLRVYYPRFSYLEQYLPAVYRDDPAAASFLDRYLANPEGILTEIEGRIERAQTLFGVRGAPPEALEWLAGWMGAMLDPEWDEARRRLFLEHAVELFRWRGTRGGLERAIRLAIEPRPDESLFDGLGSAGGGDTGGDGGVRIVEGFLTRRFPGVVLGDPTAATRPALLGAAAEWEPSQGAAPLHRLYRQFLRRLYGGGQTAPRFPPTLPEGSAADDWRDFVADELGFTYAVVDAGRTQDQELYRDFLARRHGSITALNTAHSRTGTRVLKSFAELRMPRDLPSSGAPLFDWIRFVSQVVPMHDRAHRFTVLVPAAPGEGPTERARRRERVEEIVGREKPAHTDFDVKLYWELFQVGTARLGRDTRLGEGSRFTALALGFGRLGESYLAEPHPWTAAERRVLGRDRLEEGGHHG